MKALSFNLPRSRDACAVAICEALTGALWLAGQVPEPRGLQEWHERITDLVVDRADAGDARFLRRWLRNARVRHCLQLAIGLRDLLASLSAFVHERQVSVVCLYLGVSARSPRLALIVDLAGGAAAPFMPRGVEPPASPGSDSDMELSLCGSPDRPSALPCAPRPTPCSYDGEVTSASSDGIDASLSPALQDAVRRKTLRHFVANAGALFELVVHASVLEGDLQRRRGMAPYSSRVDGAVAPRALAGFPPTRIHVFCLAAAEPDAKPLSEYFMGHGYASAAHSETAAASAADNDASEGTGAGGTLPPLAPLHCTAAAPVRELLGRSGASAPLFLPRPGFSPPKPRVSRLTGAEAWPRPHLCIYWGASRAQNEGAMSSPDEGVPATLARAGAAASEGGGGGRMCWFGWSGRLHGFSGSLPPLPSSRPAC
jgi:hypothetical protein